MDSQYRDVYSARPSDRSPSPPNGHYGNTAGPSRAIPIPSPNNQSALRLVTSESGKAYTEVIRSPVDEYSREEMYQNEDHRGNEIEDGQGSASRSNGYRMRESPGQQRVWQCNKPGCFKIYKQYVLGGEFSL